MPTAAILVKQKAESLHFAFVKKINEKSSKFPYNHFT
jgi:hypothetical protein